MNRGIIDIFRVVQNVLDVNFWFIFYFFVMLVCAGLPFFIFLSLVIILGSKDFKGQ